jgi:ribosome maturation factor RimP
VFQEGPSDGHPVTSHRADEPDRLRERVAKVVESYGLEVFDVQFRRESYGWVLRVIIDRPWNGKEPDPPVNTSPAAPDVDSVGIDDCGRVSQDLSAILDVEPELLGGLDRTYTLEVSSPGLDRPLRGERDYRRFRGRLAKIVTSAPVGGQSSFAGRLAGVEGGVVLVAEGRRTHRVPLEMIKRARLEVEF